jgi:hypothetical protein
MQDKLYILLCMCVLTYLAVISLSNPTQINPSTLVNSASPYRIPKPFLGKHSRPSKISDKPYHIAGVFSCQRIPRHIRDDALLPPSSRTKRFERKTSTFNPGMLIPPPSKTSLLSHFDISHCGTNWCNKHRASEV